MGRERRALVIASVGVVLLLLRMSASEQQRITVPRPLPSESYSHPPTFINSGAEPVNIVATFPSRRRDYTELGPNPLVKPQ